MNLSILMLSQWASACQKIGKSQNRLFLILFVALARKSGKSFVSARIDFFRFCFEAPARKSGKVYLSRTWTKANNHSFLLCSIWSSLFTHVIIDSLIRYLFLNLTVPVSFSPSPSAFILLWLAISSLLVIYFVFYSSSHSTDAFHMIDYFWWW